MEDLLVVGLDLVTGHEVHISERPVIRWREKGYGGDGTLVCLHCYEDLESASARRVPLIAKGRTGGRRRAHFAHPPGYAPTNRSHHPESLWHALGKSQLAKWARRQPEVVNATVEAWTAGGRRRSDVLVKFSTGQLLAFELQQGPITDAEWFDRHATYGCAGIRDVWLWHPRVGVPGVVMQADEAGWTYDVKDFSMSAAVSIGHERPSKWWLEGNTDKYFKHWPPCPGDQIQLLAVPVLQLGLIPAGLLLPNDLRASWAQLSRQTTKEFIEKERILKQVADTTVTTVLPARSGLKSRDNKAARDESHDLVRIDAQPPTRDDPSRRLYYCRPCNINLTAIDLDDHRV